jgi:hypothetical protein
MPTRYERAQDLARQLGFTSPYYRRQARTRELLGEELLDPEAMRALEFREEYGMSLTQAAREARIAPQRLSAIVQSMGGVEIDRSGKIIAAPAMRGQIRMITYTREYGIVFVDLDDTNASYNASYLNYVRWTFNKTIPGSKLTEPRDVEDPTRIGNKFTAFRKDKGIRTLHANAVYRSIQRGGVLDMEQEPFDFDVDLHWVVNVDTLRGYEAQRQGATTSVYARR